MRKIIIGFLSVFIISLSSFVHAEYLTYPVGIYDVQKLSGIDFNINAVRDVAMLIYMGDQDYNDQVPFGDGYDQRERDLVNRLFGTTPINRWPHAESIYSYMGLNSTFILYPGVGHEFTNESIQNEIDFFKNTMSFRNQEALNYHIIKVIPEDSDRNFSWPYYLLIPSNPQPLQTVLLVEPNNTGTQHDDWSVHNRSAFELINGWSFFAQELNTPYLVPTFPRPSTDWEVYTHALDKDSLTTDIEGLVRVDLQLIEMIEDARERLSVNYNITIEDKVFMRGFSASGTFTNRFAMLHPERVKAVASGAPGGWPILPVSYWPPRWDVEAFVTRFYQQCLGREPDAGGLAHWVNTLNSGSASGADLAWSFIFNEEFQNSGTTDDEYLKVLYRAFFNREPDQGGFNYWLSLMAGGTDRATVLEGFTTAQEFITLCDNYGIQASFTNSHSP